MKRAKEDLSNLIEKGEQQKSMYAREIAQVRDTERKMVDARDREKRQFEE